MGVSLSDIDPEKRGAVLAQLAERGASAAELAAAQRVGKGRSKSFSAGSTSIESPSVPGSGTPLQEAQAHLSGGFGGPQPDGLTTPEGGVVRSGNIPAKSGDQRRAEARAAQAARDTPPGGQMGLPGIGEPSADVRSTSRPTRMAPGRPGAGDSLQYLQEQAQARQAAPAEAPLHPQQFRRRMTPGEQAHTALQGMRQADAVGKLQQKGGWRHIIPFAFNLHQTPYGSPSAAVEAIMHHERQQGSGR